MRSLRVLFASVIAVALALATIAARAEPVKIRFGWVIVPASMVPLLNKKPGLLKHYGKSYVLDPIHFQGTPQMITALATGDVDISTLAYSSFALAIQNAQMKDLRVVADEFQDGVGNTYTNQYLVRMDSPIKTIADLRGKVLASNAGGSAVDIAIRAMLRKHGLDDRRDVTFVEVPLPNMKAVLLEKKVDLVPSVLPFAADPSLKTTTRTLFTQKEAVGTTQMIIWSSRTPFLQKNRAAMLDFMEDSIRAMHYFADPANHKEVVDLVAGFTKRPAKLFDSWLFVKGADYYRDPMMVPNLEALQDNVNLQEKLGFLKRPLNVNDYADLSLIKEAGARLSK